jgi:hypothetical protein
VRGTKFFAQGIVWPRPAVNGPRQRLSVPDPPLSPCLWQRADALLDLANNLLKAAVAKYPTWRAGLASDAGQVPAPPSCAVILFRAPLPRYHPSGSTAWVPSSEWKMIGSFFAIDCCKNRSSRMRISGHVLGAHISSTARILARRPRLSQVLNMVVTGALISSKRERCDPLVHDCRTINRILRAGNVSSLWLSCRSRRTTSIAVSTPECSK